MVSISQKQHICIYIHIIYDVHIYIYIQTNNGLYSMYEPATTCNTYKLLKAGATTYVWSNTREARQGLYETYATDIEGFLKQPCYLLKTYARHTCCRRKRPQGYPV